MARQFTTESPVDRLRKEAKRWLRGLQAGDPQARARFDRAAPGGPTAPTLRDVQLALARESGFSGWTALKQSVEERVDESQVEGSTPIEIVWRFLDNACPDHHVRGGGDHVRAQHTAMRLLERNPGLAVTSFYTAVVTGDLDAVRRALAADPGLATRADGQPGAGRSRSAGEGDLVKRDWGQKGWTPLAYLCFTRLPLRNVSENALEIARTLLDHGADPNAYFMAGGSQYTPLVGAIGEGEEARPAHPRRDELVELLLERGANPYDIQVIYNIHFDGRVLWYLEAIYRHSARTGRLSDWTDPEWQMLNAGGYGTGARWFLEIAVENNDLVLAEWCLTHGANPNAAPGQSRLATQHSLSEEAIVRGHVELAELLVRHGAVRTSLALDPIQALVGACVRGDMNAIREHIARHPGFLSRSEALFAATEHNRRDVAELLLDLGTSPDVESREGERALHVAAYYDSAEVAELLIARGADVDPIGRNYDNTPLGGAMHCRSGRMIHLLTRFSRSTWEVGYAGNVDRVRELLRERPDRARGYDGETLLMWLPPHDEDAAMQIAELLLAHGADPTIRDPQGMTAADRAERNAMYTVAAMLRERESAAK